ncbi:MAG: helix-turn-helix domain-containing protein, partial [Trueperaceae bacterium]
AFATGDLGDLLPDIDRHLAAFEAPALRARRAGTLPPDAGLAMAREALAAREDALTLFQAGRLDPDPDRSIECLLASVRAAEEAGRPYDLVRNAGALGGAYLQDGRLDEAVAWLEWALTVHAEKRVQDEDRRLRIVNELVSARMLLGETAGLRASLEEAHASLEGVLPTLAAVLRSTVASLAYAEGRDEEAAETWQAAVEASPRAAVAHVALPYVLASLRWGRVADAQRLARWAEALSRVESSAEPGGRSAAAASGTLAVALVDWVADDRDPRSLLAPCLTDGRIPIERAAVAAAATVACGGDLDAMPGRVRRLLHRVPDAVLDRWLPSEAAAVRIREALRGHAPALRLSFAAEGGPEARLHGRPIALRGRLAEVALMLVEHPNGLSDHRLHAELLGDADGYGLSALRTHVSRLRARVPVSASPYRFEVPVEADLTRARAALARGRLREALTLAPGPVLPDSDAHGVVVARERWNEELRQAALAGRDADATLALAERWEDDLELWEAASRALVDGDPRAPLVRARIRRLAREFGVDPVDPDRSAKEIDAGR